MKEYRWMFLIVGLLFLAGCSPNTSAPQVQIPGIVETIVAATSAASRAETAAVLPPVTATSSVTPTPTNTLIPTITSSPTPTYIVNLSWLTPLATITPLSGIGTGTGIIPVATSTPVKFNCNFVSQTPTNGTIMNPRQDFDWRWTVANDGTRSWLAADVSYLYIKGDKFHRFSSHAIPNDVLVGESVELIVDMEAPKEPGSYITTWALQKGANTFCIINLQIRVQ